MAGSRTVTVQLLGDAKDFIAKLGLADTAVGQFITKLKAQFGVGQLAIAGGIAGGAVLAGKALFDLGSQFDDAYDRIRTGTGATGDALKDLEGDFKRVFSSVPTDMQPASDAVTDLHVRLGLVGAPLDHIAEQFLELSRLTKTDLGGNIESVTGAFNAFGVEQKDQSSFLNELFRMYQQTGVAVSTIAQDAASAAPTMKALGFSFEQSASLAALLGKQGLSLSDVMMGFNRSLATFAKEGESAPEAFRRFLDDLKNAPDDVSANQEALEVLGARGVKFAEIVRSGGVDYESFLGKIQHGKDTIIGAGKDTNDFAEQWKIFKNTLLVEIEPVATKVFTGIGRAMEFLTEHRAEIHAFFEDFGIVVTRAWTVVEPIYEAVWEQLAAALNLIDDLIHGRWSQLWGDFVGILKAAFDLLTAPLRGAMDLFDVSFADIKNTVMNGVNAVVDFIASMPGRILDALAALPGMLFDLGVRALGLYLDAVRFQAGVILDFFRGLPGEIVAALGDLSNLLWDAGKAIMRGLINGAKSLLGDVKDFFTGLAGSITSWKGPLDYDRTILVPAGQQIMDGLIAGADSRMGQLEQFFRGIAPQISIRSAGTLPAANASPSFVGGSSPIVIENVIVLDGEVVARSTARHLNRAGGPQLSPRAIAS